MSKEGTLWILCVLVWYSVGNLACWAGGIDYDSCRSLEEIISKESEEIASTHFSNHITLVQLYISRGESYLLCAEYEKALHDFQDADFCNRFCKDVLYSDIISFRSAFGKVVIYDNLGCEKETLQEIERLQNIVSRVGCSDCKQHHSIYGMLAYLSIPIFGTLLSNNSTQDTYSDILGPDQPPKLGWCEEVVTGVGRAMDGIATLAPNYTVKVILIGIIEALIARGIKCCQAGGFWKACVAPITRKWKEWKDNKDHHILPNEKNLPQYE